MIDTVAIRNKLMHLAVSGNLVEHDIEDGNASELVEKISHEINGSSRREVAIDEIPYEIPENWTWCRLSDIGSTNIGLTYHPEDVVIDGIPVLRSNNIKNNKLIFDDLIKVNCEIREKQYIGENDILICARNGSKALVGKCAIYSGELGLTSFGAFMAVYRTQCFEYVYYYFQTKVFRRYFENENNKQINQVTQSILKDAIIPLPPIKEQKRIVEKINKVFELLDVIDEMQQQYSSDLETLKSKIIDAGIQGKLTEQLPEDGTAEELLEQIAEEKKQLIKEKKIKATKALPEITEDEIPFEIPDNWKWVRVVDIGITNTGSTPTKTNAANYGGNYPFFKPSDLDAGNHITKASEYLSELGKDASRQFAKGTILVCCIGSIGKSAIIDEDGTANQQINAWTPIMCDSNYLQFAIQSNFFINQLVDKSRATTVSIIKKSKFDSCIIPLPPLAEQERIAKRIDEIMAMC